MQCGPDRARAAAGARLRNRPWPISSVRADGVPFPRRMAGLPWVTTHPRVIVSASPELRMLMDHGKGWRSEKRIVVPGGY